MPGLSFLRYFHYCSPLFFSCRDDLDKPGKKFRIKGAWHLATHYFQCTGMADSLAVYPVCGKGAVYVTNSHYLGRSWYGFPFESQWIPVAIIPFVVVAYSQKRYFAEPADLLQAFISQLGMPLDLVVFNIAQGILFSNILLDMKIIPRSWRSPPMPTSVNSSGVSRYTSSWTSRERAATCRECTKM